MTQAKRKHPNLRIGISFCLHRGKENAIFMIKNIILDLGVVTVRLDKQRCIDAFVGLGMTDIDKHISNCKQYGLFGAIELGEMSNAEFYKRMREDNNLTATDSEIDAAWNAFILDTPTGLQNMLHNLKNKYRIYLLSNTNQIHYDYWAEYCMGTEGGNTVAECFDKCYLSNELHLAKPDPKIYKAVMTDMKAKPEECLYLDDNLQNVEEARRQGWNAEQSLSPEQTMERLKRLEAEGI